MLVKNIYELRECRCNIHACLVLDSLKSLSEDLLDDHGVLLDVLVVLSEVEEESDKWRLAVGGHQSIYLILDSLNS